MRDEVHNERRPPSEQLIAHRLSERVYHFASAVGFRRSKICRPPRIEMPVELLFLRQHSCGRGHVTELNKAIQGIPLDPRFRHSTTSESVNTDKICGQPLARGRKRAHRALLCCLTMGMHNYLVAFSDQ